MNWNRIEGNWRQMMGSAREKWGELTDDELQQVDGNRERLAGLLQERYGIAQDEAEGLAFVLAHAKSAADQDRCAAALERKCEILWALLDGLEWGARLPRLAPSAMLREEDDASVAVLPERAVRVAGSGREILPLCNGMRNVEAVAAALRERHPEDERVERDVYDFIERMEGLGVLQLAGAPG
jgi:uncharacterized protein YjbJ (UPF0337 family)